VSRLTTAARAKYYGDIDAIITNPPHTRELMHRLIEHFQRSAPTLLLIDYPTRPGAWHSGDYVQSPTMP
jgi:hypothetical protein